MNQLVFIFRFVFCENQSRINCNTFFSICTVYKILTESLQIFLLIFLKLTSFLFVFLFWVIQISTLISIKRNPCFVQFKRYKSLLINFLKYLFFKYFSVSLFCIKQLSISISVSTRKNSS